MTGFYPPRREKTRPGAGTGQALGSRGTTPAVPYSEVESPNLWPEMSNADEDDFCMTPQNRPDQYSPADSGIEDCSGEDDKEWENIDPRLRPRPVKQWHGINVH